MQYSVTIYAISCYTQRCFYTPLPTINRFCFPASLSMGKARYSGPMWSKRFSCSKNNFDYSRYDRMTPPPAQNQQSPYGEPAGSYSNGDEGDFAPVADDDLPF